MILTQRVPSTWHELQDFAAKYLNEAGYKATTPREIDTVRGKVEVDIFVEAPNELVKCIVCECKYWNTPVTKEKIHAFRTVVHDCGAELGIIISKNGYQSGAIEAAKFSNIRLETWESFLNIIFDRWINARLWEIKKMAARVQSFSDKYTYEYERLSEKEYSLYVQACNTLSDLTGMCFMVRKSDLINDFPFQGTSDYHPLQFPSIESYFDCLYSELKDSLNVLESLSIKPDNPERFISTMRMFMEE